MTKRNLLIVTAVSTLFLNGAGYAEKIEGQTLDKKDPRIFTRVYKGSSKKSHDYEWAETTITFHTLCKRSAKAIIDALSPDANLVWATIEGMVPKHTYTRDTRFTRFNPLDIQHKPSVRYTPVPAVEKDGKTLPPTARLVDICTREEVQPTDKRATSWVYDATQSFTVRSNEIPLVEGLVRQVNAIAAKHAKESKEKVDPVTVTAVGSIDGVPQSQDIGGITYGLKDETNELLFNEMVKEARRNALDDAGKYGSDRRTLHIVQAHPVGFEESSPDHYTPFAQKSAVEGATPDFVLPVEVTYTIWGKVKDQLDRKDNRVEEGTAEIRVRGTASAPSDYNESSITVTKACLTSPDEAKDALLDGKSVYDNVLSTARVYSQAVVNKRIDALKRAGKPVPMTAEIQLTDKVTDNEPSQPQHSYPYRPWAWGPFNEKTKTYPVTKFFDECANKVVDAPKEGATLPLYWWVSRAVEIKSSDFPSLYDFIKASREKNPNEESPLAVHFKFAPIVPHLLPQTEDRLALIATADTNQCLLNPKGTAAEAARSRGMDCAHLTGISDIRVIVPHQVHAAMTMSAPVMPESAFRTAAFSGGEPKRIEIKPVLKRDGERRIWEETKTFAFTYKLVSADYMERWSQGSNPEVGRLLP